MCFTYKSISADQSFLKSICHELRTKLNQYTMLHNTTQHNTIQHNTTQHNKSQHYTALHCTTLHCTALYYTAPMSGVSAPRSSLHVDKVQSKTIRLINNQSLTKSLQSLSHYCLVTDLSIFY